MNNYARALASVGIDVYLISASLSLSKDVFIEVEPHIFACKGSYKTRKGRDVAFALGVAKKLRAFINSIGDQVSILNYPTTGSLVFDIVLLLFCRKHRLYCEVNEVRRYASEMKETLSRKLYNFILELTYRWYDGVVFISSNIHKYATSIVKKSIVIPILSDCSSPFAPSRGIDTCDIVFVGTISFEKENLMELLEGFSLYCNTNPEITLALYGFISEEDKKKLNGFIGLSGVNDRIKYLGPIEHSMVATVLSSAGALVLPRTNNKQNYYGFSTKLSEYATSGAPIILTDTGVVSSFFKDGQNCLMCDGYDRLAFYKKFKEWGEMSISEKTYLAKNAYQTAKSCFDYHNYAKALAVFLAPM